MSSSTTSGQEPKISATMLKCKHKDGRGKSCAASAVFGHPGNNEPQRCDSHKLNGMEDTRGPWSKKTLLDWMTQLDSDDARRVISIIEPLPEGDARFLESPPYNFGKYYKEDSTLHDKCMSAIGFWVAQISGAWLLVVGYWLTLPLLTHALCLQIQATQAGTWPISVGISPASISAATA